MPVIDDRCLICRQDDLEPGETTSTFTRNSSTIVFKGVPALICEVCGETFLDDSVTEKLLKLAERLAAEGVEVQVRQYQAEAAI